MAIGENSFGKNAFGRLAFGIKNAFGAASNILLNLPLVKNLTLVSGTSPVTWTHTTGYVLHDHTGEYVLCAAGEAGIEGGRREHNILKFGNDISSAFWSKVRCTVIGTNKIVADGAVDPHMQQFNATVTGGVVGGRTFGFSVVLWTDPGRPTACQLLITDSAYQYVAFTNITITTTPQEYYFSTTINSAATSTNWYARVDLPQTPAVGDYIYVENFRGGEVLTAAALPLDVTVNSTATATVEWFDTANGNTVNATTKEVTRATGTALTTIKGTATDRGTTNKCTGYNLQPDAALTGHTKTGDAAATLTRVTNVPAVVAAKFGRLNPMGYLMRLDNSAGVADAIDTIGGTTTNLLKHSFSALIMGGTGSIALTGGVGSVAFGASAALVKRSAEDVTPGVTTNQVQIIASPGQIVDFFAWQLTETAYAARIIENTAGTATSTTDATGTLPVAGNLALAEGTVYCEVTTIALGSLIKDSGIISGNSSTRRLIYLHNTGVITAFDGVTAISVFTEVLVAGTTYKAAVSYSTALAAFTISVNGVSTAGTYNGSFSASDLVRLGSHTGGSGFPGSVKNLITYPNYKTATELNAMTV